MSSRPRELTAFNLNWHAPSYRAGGLPPTGALRRCSDRSFRIGSSPSAPETVCFGRQAFGQLLTVRGLQVAAAGTRRAVQGEAQVDLTWRYLRPLTQRDIMVLWPSARPAIGSGFAAPIVAP